MDAPTRTSTPAIVSLVAGVLSWVGLPLVGAVVAIVTGHVARAEIRREQIQGDGMAVAGLVLGYLNIVLSLLAIALFLLPFFGAALFGVFAGGG